MIGVAVVCTRRMLNVCNDLFKSPIFHILLYQNLKHPLSLLRKRLSELSLAAFMLRGRRPEDTLTMGCELIILI